MIPVGPDEIVDEKDSINVIGKDGSSKQYRKRTWGAWLFKNTAPSNDFLEIAVKVFTVGKLMVGFIVALGGMFWGLNEYWVLPHQKTMIQAAVVESMKPINDRLDEDERLFRDHLIDIERQRGLFPTRTELRADLTEIKAMIQRLENR